MVKDGTFGIERGYFSMTRNCISLSELYKSMMCTLHTLQQFAFTYR